MVSGSTFLLGSILYSVGVIGLSVIVARKKK